MLVLESSKVKHRKNVHLDNDENVRFNPIVDQTAIVIAAVMFEHFAVDIASSVMEMSVRATLSESAGLVTFSCQVQGQGHSPDSKAIMEFQRDY